MSASKKNNNRASDGFIKNLQNWIARLLYILLFTLLLPLLFVRLLWRSIRAPAYRQRVLERCGIFSTKPNFNAEPKPNGIWVHAVSVGEVAAALPLIKQLRQRYPKLSITVTTTTPTGSDYLVKSLQAEGIDDVFHCYMPYDWPPFMYLFLQRIKPKILIIIETELWPVSLWLCSLKNIPVVLANARLSEKSAKGYQKLTWLSRAMLRDLSVATQYDDDAARFLALGLPEKQLQLTGSVKFDIQLSAELNLEAQKIKQRYTAMGKGFIWIAASTHKGEDEVVLTAHQQILQQFPNTLLILVPRHPERFDDVAQLITDADMQLARLSSEQLSNETTISSDSSVLLVDSMGQLLKFYGVADTAFVGGSLFAIGGHNTIEPAAWGVPVLSGPHQFNFAEVAKRLEQAGVLVIVNDAKDLAAAVVERINKPELCAEQGKAAQRVIDNNRGAQDKLLNVINRHLN